VGIVTDSGKAVFLSYASQDAQAAQHLCNALRAAGIEVWFDQSALRGGDAWDASIRRQIKTCALFIPVISNNTHTRGEGYFRLEWKLAVDRSHLMASDLPFLLPVVVDDTADQEDRVPDRFRELQWTRLPAGANTDAFVDHVRRLLSLAPTVPAATAAHSPPMPASSTSVPSAIASARSTPPKSRSFAPWIVGALLIVATGYIVFDKVLAPRPAAQGQAPTAVSVPADAVNDKSIAVLPFADMSEKKDQEYFSDGLAEELIEQLGKTPGLRVIARTSAFSFKGKPDDIPTIAAKLKVANVLEGSVRRFGNQLRVSTQLIRADSGQPIWSETFDREFKDVFKIQDEIATAVVSALKLTLAGGQMAPGAHGTTNPEAYDAFLLARQLFLQATTESDYRETIEAYQKAIGLDPRYADAYAELALTEYFAGDDTGNRALEQSAEQTVQKAIDMDPRRANGYAVRGVLRYCIRYDWVGAEADFRQALALDPTDIRVLSRYASMLSNVGRLEQAEVMRRKGIELDPLDDSNWAGLGGVLVSLRNYTAATDAFRRARALRPGGSSWKSGLGLLQLLDGQAREALVTFQSMSFSVYRDTGVAQAAYTLGDSKASQEALERLIAASAGIAAYQIAEVYAWRGEKDKAFEWLERAYRQQDGGLVGTKSDPLLASLRSDPRHVAMLRKLNLSP
jgi:TolB-like protein/Flp pilus assembly protein TadD